MKPLWRRRESTEAESPGPGDVIRAAFKPPNPWPSHVPKSVNSLSLSWYFCPLQQKESSLVLQWQRHSQGQRYKTRDNDGTKVRYVGWGECKWGWFAWLLFNYKVSISIEQYKGDCFSPHMTLTKNLYNYLRTWNTKMSFHLTIRFHLHFSLPPNLLSDIVLIRR